MSPSVKTPKKPVASVTTVSNVVGGKSNSTVNSPSQQVSKIAVPAQLLLQLHPLPPQQL
jgi:hypothetical protein